MLHTEIMKNEVKKFEVYQVSNHNNKIITDILNSCMVYSALRKTFWSLEIQIVASP